MKNKALKVRGKEKAKVKGTFIILNLKYIFHKPVSYTIYLIGNKF